MRLFGLGVAVVVLIVDQASKLWLIDLMVAHPEGIRLGPFLDLVQVWNYGISFGLFNQGEAGNALIFVAITAVITAFLIGWLWRGPGRLVALALGLVIGGAVGNAIDRLRLGAVADFFYFHIDRYYWPAFNVADSGIVCGVGLLLLDSLVISKEKS